MSILTILWRVHACVNSVKGLGTGERMSSHLNLFFNDTSGKVLEDNVCFFVFFLRKTGMFIM